VTVADRYETMATAIAASYMNIPVVHVQGGEVTGSIDEKVRHAVTKLSNLHFVATEKAAERVIRMGENPATVFVTGCPSIDLAAAIMEKPSPNIDPFAKYGGVGPILDISNGYVVVIQHPVTTEYAEAKQQVMETLYAMRDLGMPALWFWPNVDAGSDGTSKGIRTFREFEQAPNIHFFKNMWPEDFLCLVYNSKCIVGNSSMAIRECAYLGVPAVNIGIRQRGRERVNNVIDVDHERSAIKEAICHHLANGRYPSNSIYGNGKAGQWIADLLAHVQLNIEKRLTY
jgi:UDP-hydrolysing UDP-N-acetyl-D-glucosamine 2-epimerase